MLYVQIYTVLTISMKIVPDKELYIYTCAFLTSFCKPTMKFELWKYCIKDAVQYMSATYEVMTKTFSRNATTVLK